MLFGFFPTTIDQGGFITEVRALWDIAETAWRVKGNDGVVKAAAGMNTTGWNGEVMILLQE